ncbi:hypothetical protein [Emticicia sp. BO119]|uniref:hypothetical protein n=1 Tax=Emticicia sp. BO119 TaxID=2757768 RepID=UPI0015F020BA|nr:hypothetical protein [Emticicia sp. BO119]MBA4849022.1 hypothetical protein [Emticicia sp. BO119]
MKKIQSVFIFEGGRQGYFNLIDSEEKVTFCCHSADNVTAASKLDIAFNQTYPKHYTEVAQRELAKYRREGMTGDVALEVVNK